MGSVSNSFSKSELRDLASIMKLNKTGTKTQLCQRINSLLSQDQSGGGELEIPQSITIPFKSMEDYGEQIKRLGKGSYGFVYLYQTKDNDYALKRIENDYGINDAALKEIVILKFWEFIRTLLDFMM